MAYAIHDWEAQYDAQKQRASAPPAVDWEAEYEKSRASRPLHLEPSVVMRRPPSPETGNVDLRQPEDLAATRAAAERQQHEVATTFRPDATRLRPERNPQAHRLEGGAAKATEVFQSLADNPVSTATAIPLAPVRAAGTAGLFLGQKLNDLADRTTVDLNANDVAASMGVPRISDREAAFAAAQLATLAGGEALHEGVTKGVRALGGGRMSTTAGRTAQGMATGAAFDEKDPTRGALIGGALGAVADVLPRLRVATPAAREPITDPERLLATRKVQPTAEAHVVDEPAAAVHEPDVTLEPLDWEKMYDQEKRAAAAAPVASEPPIVAEKPPIVAPERPIVSPPRGFESPDWDPAAGEPKSVVLARERLLADAPIEGVSRTGLENRLTVLDRLASTDVPEHASRAKQAADAIRAQLAQPEAPTATPAADERTAPDLFGETQAKSVEQGSMFGDAAGTEGSRPLVHAEAAARSELQQLSERYLRTTDPAQRTTIAARMSELDRLVNRDKTITQEEMARRAVGDATPIADAAEAATREQTLLRNGTKLDTPVDLPPEAPPPVALPPTASARAIGPGHVYDDDGVIRFASARAPGGGRRAVQRVSTRGLLQELLDIEPRRANATLRSSYDVKSDINVQGGVPQVVSTKGTGAFRGGPSQQAKAQRNLDDFERITSDVLAQLEQRMPMTEIWNRLEDLRAENDERAGMAGDFSAQQAAATLGGRGEVPIRDPSGKVLFAQAPHSARGAPGASRTRGPRAPRGAGTSGGGAVPPAAAGPPPPTPGATQRVVAGVAQSVATHIGAIRRTLAPATVSIDAARTSRIFRHELGAGAHDYERAVSELHTFARQFDRMPVAETRAFIDRMERDQPQPTPALTAAAREMRRLLDTLRDRIRALGTGVLDRYIEHYFPHIWKDPITASTVFARMMGAKRPFEGTRAFKKQRTIPYTSDGIAAGLEPVTENPVELVLLKLREMRTFLTAHLTMERLKTDGLVSFVSAGRRAPTGMVALNDKIATVFGPPHVVAEEAFDVHIRQALEQTIANLDAISPLEHTRKARMGGKLGYASSAGNEMASMFGSHDGVIMHELGHILDARYGLWALLTKQKGVIAEMRALAKLRYEGQPPPTKSYERYVQKRQEKIANALHAFLHAPERMGAVAPLTQLALAKFLSSRPELAPLVDAQPSLVLGTATTQIPVGGMVIKGAYYAPSDVARVFNNHLSPGLRGSPWYDTASFLNNAMNTVQLGLSGFHLGFVALDTTVSQTAVTLQNLFAGRLRTAGLQAIQIPIAPVSNVLRGHSLYRAYLNKGAMTPALAQAVEHIIRAGGRVRSDSFYHLGALDRLLKAWRRGEYGKVAGWTIPAIFDATVKPVLEWYVPRAKLGVFLQLAEHELRDVGATASVDAQLATLQRAWDSVDNRLGQLVYDNLFWGKTFKDLSQISVRAVGWNLGVLREIPGGVADVGTMLGAGARGQRPDFTAKAAYITALPIVVGLVGAIVNYLMTGEGPRELKDYFFPRTGKKNPDGDDERLTLPSYVKDVVAYHRHPLDTVLHKLAPLWDIIASMLENKDFFGDQIRNPDDNLMKRRMQEAAYVARTVQPLGIQNLREAKQREQTTGVKVSGFFGLTEAPRELTRTAAENKIMQYVGAAMPTGATPEEAAHRRDRAALKAELRTDPAAGKAAADSAYAAGGLSRRERIDLSKAARANPWNDRFKRLTLEQAQRVIQLATPEERAQWEPLLRRKAFRAGKALPAGTP